MKSSWKAAAGAFAFAIIAGFAAPAGAQNLGIGLGFGPGGGITFSYDSGGYCDRFGCPDAFWDLPVYYGPVFYRGEWYRGPVYYRMRHGERQYWIHGNWRRDEWRGRRPDWAREGRYGPALGMDYYRNHGFHGRWDRDRDMRNRGRDWRGDQNFDRRGNDYRGSGDASRGFGRDDRSFNGRTDMQENRRGFDRNNGNAGSAAPNDNGGGGVGPRGARQNQNGMAQQSPGVQPGGQPPSVTQPAPVAPAPAAQPTPPAPPVQDGGGDRQHRGPRGGQPNQPQ